MTTDDTTEISVESRSPSDAPTRTIPAAVPDVAKSRRAPRTADAGPDERSLLASPGIAETADRSLHAGVARYTAGLSPAALALAYLDWATPRSYQVMTRPAEGHYVDPDTWLATATRKDGSWWPQWSTWLNAYSGAPGDEERTNGRRSGVTSLGPAPGTYVLQP